MVQKQATYNRDLGSNAFADDDPLAELARIVGYDAPASREPEAPVIETAAAFNLEDELLREFATYDAPAVRPAYVAPVVQPVAPVEDDLEDLLPVAEEAAPYAAFEDDAAPADEEPDSYWPDEPVTVAAGEPEVVDDLANELEWAIAETSAPEVRAAEMRDTVQSTPTGDPMGYGRFRLPIANFHPVSRETPRVEPDMAAAPVASVPVPETVEPDIDSWTPAEASLDAEPSFDLPADFDLSAEPSLFADVEPKREEVDAARREPAFDDVAPEPALDDFGFDGLMDDLPGLDAPRAAPAPVATPAPVPAVAAMPAPAPQAWQPSDRSSFADELAESETVASPYRVVEPAEDDAVAAGGRAAADDADLFDPFADGEFELQLDDIDLNLNDFDIEDEPVAATPVAPVVVVPPRVVAPAPVPVAFVPEPDIRLPAGDDSVLPFDASEISEQEDHPESISAVDVPEFPVVEAAEPVSFPQDYDIDIDSELATLFDTTPDTSANQRTAPAAAAAVATAASVAAAKPAAASPADDFDDFERALEEDFRRTLHEPQTFAARRSSSIPLPQDDEPVLLSDDRPRSRGWLLAASVAAVAVLGAGGIYAWMNGTAGNVMNSGEPRVVMADKEPVKVVPENKGGKSVPNQDKAVYDRVAGAAVEDPKQESLISSNEEPVDVVQKTLIPETLPLEGEDDTEFMPTPVGETEDPRLLPGQTAETAEAQSGAADPVTITPRKVRTMIVKPDGTLVAQEVPAQEPAATPAAKTTPAPAETAALPQAELPAATPAVNSAPVDGTAAPATTVQTVPVGQATEAAIQTEAPAAAAPAATPAPRMPVPTARPAEQPVNVVGRVTEQGNVAPAVQQPAQRAAAAPQATPPAATAAVPAGGYVIQIASLPSQAEAQKSYQSLSAKFSGVIGGKGVDIKQADIAGKGTFYRVRIPAGSKADAVAMCERYRAAGGSCLVAR
ncbi:sporulation protein [Rhizobium sp. CG5]|uniref:SPOR domain-containing protein n=1 Tax=Rhizobium sp. CG5 TaxID=2726076 RepID=UPI0020341024|nr:SPOR domain-containing protein [Rhizobium sp. CG5]MCM2472187.1 sporulation protein [Rhizobium sp. CG5]